MDIFAAGVVLFLMITGCPPFGEAKPTNIHYKAFMKKHNNTYWEWVKT